MKRSINAVFTHRLMGAMIVMACVLASSAWAQDKSDVSGVVFKPSSATLKKGGATKTFTVNFNGTANSSDNGHVKVNITESDPLHDDLLINVDITCTPPLTAGSNFSAVIVFKLKCSASSTLWGAGVVLATITDPNTGAILFSGVPLFTNYESDDEDDHEVRIEDVPDNENHGSLVVRCRDFTGIAHVIIGDVSGFMTAGYALSTAREAKADFENLGFTTYLHQDVSVDEATALISQPDVRAVCIIGHGWMEKKKTCPREGIFMADGLMLTDGSFLPATSFPNMVEVIIHACGQDQPSWRNLFPNANFYAWSSCFRGYSMYYWQLLWYPGSKSLSVDAFPPLVHEALWSRTFVSESGYNLRPYGSLLDPLHQMDPIQTALFGNLAFNVYSCPDGNLGARILLHGAVVEDGHVVEENIDGFSEPDFNVTIVQTAMYTSLECPTSVLSSFDQGDVVVENFSAVDDEIILAGFAMTHFGVDGSCFEPPDTCACPRAPDPGEFTIEKTHNTPQGGHQSVDIVYDSDPLFFGGFDFLIAYDASALALQSVVPGPPFYDPAPDGCGWEYFTYRHGPFGNCDNACPSGMVRVFGLAETNNGPNHPNCFLPDCLPATLFSLDFLVSNDRTLECMYVPVRFFWMDCGDNSISSVDGEVLYVSDHVYEFEGTDITDSTYGFPTYFGVQEGCLNPDPDKPTLIRLVDYTNGGVDIVCADSIDDRGDINLNGVVNEVADAVLYSNYFVHGISVFNVNIDGQIAASDVNADGITLSVADLVYMIRIITGDALPYPKLTAMTANADLVNGVLSVDTDMGAAYVVVERSITPQLLVESMEMKYLYDADHDLTRILVYSMEKGHLFNGDFLGGIDGNVITLEMATYEGAPVTTKLVPDEFALYPSYPNPFNPITTISFALAAPVDYELVIYNSLGQTVETFSGHAGPGLERIDWNATGFASGVYFYRLTAGDFTDTRKMVLLK